MTNLCIIDIREGSSSVYGIGTYINILEKSLQKSDLHICYIHLKSDTQRFLEKIEDGAIHWYIPTPQIKYKDKEKQDKLYFLNSVFILRQYIRSTDNLIFHLNNIEYKSLADALRKFFDCKIILAVHYFPWCFDISGNTSLLQKILRKSESKSDQLGVRVKKTFTKEREFLYSVDKILCLSKYTNRILQNIYKIKEQKISLIYNGLTDNYSTSNKQALRKKYHIPDIPVILFAGRLDEMKGLMYALQAFKKVLKTSPCHFVIAGNGVFDTFMKECEDIWIHVTWTGLVCKEKLYELYTIADIGIMPSFNEQCSFVAIEMMMHGLPMIASASTGLSEMVEDGITGLHIPVIEYDAKAQIDTSLLAEKILYLLTNPSERQSMGQNARKHYESRYTQELFRKNMLKFYQSI